MPEEKNLPQPKRIEITDDVIRKSAPAPDMGEVFITDPNFQKAYLPSLPGQDPQPAPWAPDMMKSEKLF